MSKIKKGGMYSELFTEMQRDPNVNCSGKVFTYSDKKIKRDAYHASRKILSDKFMKALEGCHKSTLTQLKKDGTLDGYKPLRRVQAEIKALELSYYLGSQ